MYRKIYVHVLYLYSDYEEKCNNAGLREKGLYFTILRKCTTDKETEKGNETLCLKYNITFL